MTTQAALANAERTDLNFYIEQNALLLTHDEVLSETREFDNRKIYIYWSIGELACHLSKVGEDETAVKLVDQVLTEIDADEEAVLLTWSSAAEKGAEAAGSKLRDAMGLEYDENGNTILPDTVDMSDGRTFHRLLSLYKFGDTSVSPYLHRFIGNLEGDRVQNGVAHAVKVYEAGDETAYDLIKATAEKARTHALAQQPKDKEPEADDASDIAQLFKGISNALSPSRSETEKLYAQADIALKYFAKSLLEKGDVRRADEIQSLMLSSFDSAWVSAQRFELGYDPDGKHAQAAKDYIKIYGEESGNHATKISDALVRGGDTETLAEYEIIFDPSIKAGDVDTHTAAHMLVALHRSGDIRAHDRLIELLQEPRNSLLLILSLEEMGFKNEAIAIAKKEFADHPNYKTGLTLLNLQYDSNAMKAVQTGASEIDRDLITIINSHCRHLGFLASRIVEIEQKD